MSLSPCSWQLTAVSVLCYIHQIAIKFVSCPKSFFLLLSLLHQKTTMKCCAYFSALSLSLSRLYTIYNCDSSSGGGGRRNSESRRNSKSWRQGYFALLSFHLFPSMHVTTLSSLQHVAQCSFYPFPSMHVITLSFIILPCTDRSLTAIDETLIYICSTCYVNNLLKQNIGRKKVLAITTHEGKLIHRNHIRPEDNGGMK